MEGATMLKVGAFLIVLLMTSMLGMWVGGRTGVKKSGEVKPDKIQIILYSQGKITYLDEHSLYFKDVLAESKSLFLTAE
jgi:hypothetical protein